MTLPELLWDTLSINFRYEPFQDLPAYIIYLYIRSKFGRGPTVVSKTRRGGGTDRHTK